MIKTSLRAFKIKPKPSFFSVSFLNATGSTSAPRMSRLFSVSAEETVDPVMEARILEIAKNFLADIKHSKPHRLNDRATFASLGLDSLDSMDLIIEFEERLGLDLSEEDAEHRVKSIRDACLVFSDYSKRPQTSVKTMVQSARLSI